MSDDVYLIASISNRTHVLRLLNIIFAPYRFYFPARGFA
jgi:hypothetical protein